MHTHCQLASSSDDAADRGINAEARIELAKAVGVLITSFGAQRLNKDPQTSKVQFVLDAGHTLANRESVIISNWYCCRTSRSSSQIAPLRTALACATS